MNRRTFLTTSAATMAACAGTAPPDPLASLADPGRLELATLALQAATDAGASWADARVAEYRNQRIATREARVTNVSDRGSYGVGVRVIAEGTWGFAASADATPEEVVRIAKLAVTRARANARLQREPVQLIPARAHRGTWRTPIRRDPFDVPLSEKVEHLLSLNAAAMALDGVSFCSSWMHFVREHKLYANTDGTRVEQVLHRCNPSFTVTSVRDGSFTSRNALASPQGRGYEFIEDYPWLEDARQAADDAVAMHSATSVEPGPRDLILVPSHLWLTIHESIGHPTELDRALGLEANYAGTSFLTPDKLDTRIGSDLVSFQAERVAEGALATCKWDDDGVPTTEWDLVRNGRFVDYQTTRDQAHWIGRDRSYACSYADSWGTVAFQRMPNINLVSPAGPLTLADLIADTEDAILIEGRGSYSIDHQRYNFQFGGQVFRRVENGAITGLLRDVAYQSTTTEFWNACDAICDASEYQVNGSFYDGKGEPGQVNAVSHGCAPARFRQVDVINTGREV